MDRKRVEYFSISFIWIIIAILWLSIIAFSEIPSSSGQVDIEIITEDSSLIQQEKDKRQATATPQDSSVHHNQLSEKEGKRGSCVNVNSAKLEQLDDLPGIGPVLAQRIIDSRKADTQYENADQLLEIKGIGPATVKKISPFICF